MEYTWESTYANRVALLNDCAVNASGNCVIYWMQRSQRAEDNHALTHAVWLANSLNKPVLVYFGLFQQYPMASERVFRFMLEGLVKTADAVRETGAAFLLRTEDPSVGICRLANEVNACAVVVDQDYLRNGRQWRKTASESLGIPLIQVDSDTIVPVSVHHKEEYAAYTIRPRIRRILPGYLKELPKLVLKCAWSNKIPAGIELSEDTIDSMLATMKYSCSVKPVGFRCGGTEEAMRKLDDFIQFRLPRYSEGSNNIGEPLTSELSPYLHFGQISPLRIALEVLSRGNNDENTDAYLEQLIVRRELAINYCWFNENYDSVSAAADWAVKTLEAHRYDSRPELYSLEELEAANTHDDIWNSAQMELIISGSIHTYMRMVWAKCIMEWSPSPEEALSRVIYLNDKYALDGRDPNGYAGAAWSIFGKHDRAFAERSVFGKIRFMSTKSIKIKKHFREYMVRLPGL